MEQREVSVGPAFCRGLGPESATYLDTTYYTLGEAMRDAGYATSFFGKWHQGHKPYIPENHGFETVYGGRWHPGPPGKDRDRRFYPPWNDCETLDSNLPADTHVDDYITDMAIDYLAEHKDEPFFMCFWPYSVHAPFQSKPELIEKWKNKIDPNDPQRSPTMAAMIEVLDENVGRLMATLEETGLSDNTIVLFLSDNGGNMYDVVDGTTPTNNKPLRSGKSNSLEGGVRVPFMVRWPGVTQAGSVSDAIVSTVDLYATLLEMTSQPLRPEDHKESVSFVPALKGDAYDRPPLLWERAQFMSFVGNLPNSVVRDDNWKLIRYWFDAPDGTHRHALYNLDLDISETKDVADAHPEVTQRLKTVLDQFFAEEGIKQYHPNENYDGHRINDSWAALSQDGDAAMQNGVMTMSSKQPGFGIYTPMTPNISDFIFHFEARSKQEDEIKLQWTSRAKTQRTEQASRTVTSGKDWAVFSVPVKTTGNASKIFLTLSEGGTVELRNMRLATPEGTVMMTYDR